MKKFLFVMSLVILTFIISRNACAENDSYGKLKRGAINIFTAPLEVPKQIKGEWKNHPGHLGVKALVTFGGLMKGVAYAGGRLGSGLWDVFTFNLEIPKGYEPLMKPDYICGHNGE